jgi:hypothetical protein
LCNKFINAGSLRISLEYSIFLSQAALMAAKQTRSERDEDLTALRVEIQVVLKEV